MTSAIGELAFLLNGVSKPHEKRPDGLLVPWVSPQPILVCALISCVGVGWLFTLQLRRCVLRTVLDSLYPFGQFIHCLRVRARKDHESWTREMEQTILHAHSLVESRTGALSSCSPHLETIHLTE